MDNQNNRYIAVAYTLYAAGEKTLQYIEEATEEHPFQFVTGFGFTLDAFEKQIIGLEKGAEFNFTLSKEEAYGNVYDERIVNLERAVFMINGHFDHENVFVDAILPLQNEDGHMFQGRVLEINDDFVKVDLNHPLAGKELNFKGHIVENRQATPEEVQSFVQRLTGEGCGCGCDSCDDGCGHQHQHEGTQHEHCGCGHCHH